MKKYGFLLLLITSPLLFGNFGMVEYAVLHPKTKTVQADSLNRKQRQVNLYAPVPQTPEVNSEEEKSSTMHWGDYLVMGMKAIGGLLLKILAKF
ncbi:MAG: hypothetical protein RIS42_1229 [Bacteroidota bacterium]|jgi:hypothetical protein